MNITFYFTRPEWTAPDIRAAVSEGLGAGLQIMHGQRTKLKFTRGGMRAYGIRERSKVHVARKKREKGHNLPNVWSGTGRSEILRPMAIRTLKTKATAIGRMRARFLNLSNALGWTTKRGFSMKARGFVGKRRERNKQRQPDHIAEMEALVKIDEKIIADVTTRHVGRFFDRKGRKKTIKI